MKACLCLTSALVLSLGVAIVAKPQHAAPKPVIGMPSNAMPMPTCNPGQTDCPAIKSTI
jgi:hypothetical protein